MTPGNEGFTFWQLFLITVAILAVIFAAAYFYHQYQQKRESGATFRPTPPRIDYARKEWPAPPPLPVERPISTAPPPPRPIETPELAPKTPRLNEVGFSVLCRG